MKYIAPGGWFSLEYPINWHEFEDAEDTFLFYDPNNWNGNFRISATKGQSKSYGHDCLQDELKDKPSAVISKIGNVKCVYSVETFQENNAWYTIYWWVLDYGEICIDCSFTTLKNGEKVVAEKVIQSIVVPKVQNSFKNEIIPLRIIEVGQINTAFAWVEKAIKKELTKDFTGVESDIAKIQQLIDQGFFQVQQRDVWNKIGLTFGSILVKEIDGMEWNSYIDGTTEIPVLHYINSEYIIAPSSILWKKIKRNRSCNLMQEYEKILMEINKVSER